MQKDKYRNRLSTMCPYTIFYAAEDSNKRYHYLLVQGAIRFSVAFDLPTQVGYDSDHEMTEGEVGNVGASLFLLWPIQGLIKGCY